MEKYAQKVFDRADIVRDVRFAAWNSSGENSEWSDGGVVWMAFHLLAGSRSHAHHCDIVSVWSAKQPPRCEDVMARADPFRGRSGAAPAHVACGRSPRCGLLPVVQRLL